MKNKKLLCFMLFLFFIGIFLTTFWKDYTYAKSKIDESKKYAKIDVPFDINSERLSPKFTGDNIMQVYEMLNKNIPKRGEYDSAKDYLKRIEPLIHQNFYAFRLTNVYHFWSEYNSIVISYDPNTEVLKVTLDPKSLSSTDFTFSVIESSGGRKSLSVIAEEIDSKFPDIIVKGKTISQEVIPAREYTIPVKLISKKSGNYIGETGFGARRMITKISELSYYLSLTNSDVIVSEFVVDKYKTNLMYEIMVPPDKAKNIKPYVGVLAICKLTPTITPYFSLISRTSPNINNLSEVNRKNNYISVSLEAIWIYNTNTGEILHKHNLTENAGDL